MVLAPVIRQAARVHMKKYSRRIRKEGFTQRPGIDGEIIVLLDEDEIKLEKTFKHTIEIVVDRIVVKPGQESTNLRGL